MERPRKKPHRLPMQDYARPDFVYAFTICCAGRRERLRDEGIAKVVIDTLLWTREKYGWLLFAYCLMPEHLHIVFRNPKASGETFNTGARGTTTTSVLEHIARLKSFTTKRFHDLGHSGLLW